MNTQNTQNTQFETNRVMLADSYKYSHPWQYPKGTTAMYDYAEARSSKVYPKTVFFGLQYILKEYFTIPISEAEVVEAKMYAKFHGIPFDSEGWMYIAQELQGKLPVKIRAVKEGSVIPNGNVLFTIESTDPKVFWVASWLETVLMKVWYTCNVATRSYYVKQMLIEYAEKTQDTPFVDLQFHNFGDRGSSSVESAGIGGMAHLTQFLGTDNFQSIKYIDKFYGQDSGSTEHTVYPQSLDKTIERREEFLKSVGISIPATEHSTTTSWGKNAEFDMIENHIKNNKGQYIIAGVMDSYNYLKAVDIVTGVERFRSLIDSPEYPIFVLRPDSGDPIEMINATIDIMEENGVPFTENKKGYKVWDKYRIIWGDGIDMEAMKSMLDILEFRGYSSENIAFGSGGWLMQQHDRDTLGFAVKCSSITVNGEERDVFKDPITAPNKKSKKGRVTTYYNPATDTYFTDKIGEDFEGAFDVLETVFENGVMAKTYNINDIRDNSKNSKG